MQIERLRVESWSECGHNSPKAVMSSGRSSTPISDRLRGRDSLFVKPNECPVVFVASSGAAKPILDRVSKGLRSDNRKVNAWSDPDIFAPSDFTLDSLLAQAQAVDFAVIVATPDDLVQKNSKSWWRGGNVQQAARDNVLLEFGLFAGALERQRVVVLEQKGVGLPTDMQGLTTLRFTDQSDLDGKIAEIARCVDRLGPLQRLRRKAPA
jgi:predicted nucleotide-binding protein